MKITTVNDVEGLRGQLFHMIIFSMAWSLIGEYLLDFRDYAAGMILTLIGVVLLALYTIKMYDLEAELADYGVPSGQNLVQRRRDRSYALILLLEGIAILVTWAILLKLGQDNRLIPAFALVAGLHFFPLAKVIRLSSYYYLGAWICVLAVAGYLLSTSGSMTDKSANIIVAYGCTAGSLVDGIVIVFRTGKLLNR